MATILLSSVGSLFGPVGQIAGTLAGSAIDSALFAPKDIEGARLKELAVSASSYGTPIAAQYGRMRVPGTVIWSTELSEHSERHSNGKGQPKTVSYSYSVSFAVALSSRPIDDVGRIWADGNLLRGAAGDLKSGGTLRIHRGHGDQPRDPLMEAALGERCPAFRGCAYAVFEDLDLTDFGNRIPALSFEVMAGDAARLVETMLAESEMRANPSARFSELEGFSHEGGSLRDIVQLVDRLHPVAARDGPGGIVLTGAPVPDEIPATLPPPAAWDDGEFGQQAGSQSTRSANTAPALTALRYYDPARDYQAGLQHAESSNPANAVLQFPGALTAADALDLAQRANRRAAIQREQMLWRSAELDPAIGPGTLVTAPGQAGIWQVTGWEWRERGVELELVRYRAGGSGEAIADPGAHPVPADRLPVPTMLRVFETPWDGSGTGSSRRVYAAAGAGDGRWPGCAFYAERDGALVATGQSATQRSGLASLLDPLEPSSAIRFEPRAQLRLRLLDRTQQLSPTDMAGLAQGENRLLVGGEVLQFGHAQPEGDGCWTLTGLLRGRGGTEIEARAGHAAGVAATLLDNRLIELSAEAVGASTGGFAAIGPWDDEPVMADVTNPGASLRPPSPVHGGLSVSADGALTLRWTRRARGQWLWPDEVELPLVEEREAYEIGFGPVDAPRATWTAQVPWLEIAAGEVAALLAAHGQGQLWVRQIGQFASSPACLVGQIA